MNARHLPRRDPIHLLIADSTRMGSELLADALGRDRRLSIIGCAADWDELYIAVSKRPQVTIVGMDFEKVTGGLDATRKLIEQDPETRVVMLLDDGSDHNLVVEAFRSGARGIFSRAESASVLGRCIHVVHAGQVWATSEQVGYLLEAWRNCALPRFINSEVFSLLSSREQEVVRFVAEGLANREIAQKMNLSEHTVKNHLFRIFSRLGISSRVEIMFALTSQSFGVRQSYGSSERRVGPLTDAEVFQSFLRQAEHDPSAQYRVGEMYVEGRGVERDEPTGYRWLLLSEESAHEVIAKSKSLRKDVAAHIEKERLKESGREALKPWQARDPANGHAPQSFSPDALNEPAEVTFASPVAKAG